MNGGKTVGVLGGMGPMATVEFFRRLVAATPADTDQEHLHILIDNDPGVPDRTCAILHGGPSPVGALAAMARRLEGAGSDLLAMPCNTAHVFLEQIRKAVSIPVLDMIREAADAVDRPSVGLLATDGTIRTGLYQRACAARGVRVMVPGPGDQRVVMEAIARVKRGEDPRRLGSHLGSIVRRLADGGAEAVVAGCTELSLVPGDGMAVAWIDALDCLVAAALREARSDIRKRSGKEAK